MSMKLVHISDTHLGYFAYRKLNPDGLNQREADCYNAFSRAIDLALQIKPDVVLHAGDLFDTVRPTNRAMAFAAEQTLRLSEEGIPTVIISGNHSTPRMKETGSPLRFLNCFEDVHAVFDRPRTIDLPEARIHAIPQCPSPVQLKEALSSVNDHLAKDRYNILMLHVGVVGLQAFKTGEFNEQIVSQDELDPALDYIALGHYHQCVEVTPNAWYAGSTERFGFGEVGQDKGILEVDLDRHEKKFHPLPVRDMLDLTPIECGDLTPGQITQAIVDAIPSDTEDKIVRLRLRSIPRHVYRSIDQDAVRSIFANATHFELVPDILEEGEMDQVQRGIGALTEEFSMYVDERVEKDGERVRLKRLGLRYLEGDEA